MSHRVLRVLACALMTASICLLVWSVTADLGYVTHHAGMVGWGVILGTGAINLYGLMYCTKMLRRELDRAEARTATAIGAAMRKALNEQRANIQ